VKALIIEDEPLAIDGLRQLLKTHEDFIEIIGVAGDGIEGSTKIEALKPELIFLDINIPLLNGLDMLRSIKNPPNVVFTTAYDQHAIKAFELNAVDYLLKPIEPERFALTMQRLKALPERGHEDHSKVVKVLESYLEDKKFTTISVKLGDRILFIPLDSITHFFADDKYVVLNTQQSQQHVTDITIQDLQAKLPGNFIRISRSTIINALHIHEARKHFGKKYSVLLKDTKGSVVETGSKYVDNFLTLLSS